MRTRSSFFFIWAYWYVSMRDQTIAFKGSSSNRRPNPEKRAKIVTLHYLHVSSRELQRASEGAHPRGLHCTRPTPPLGLLAPICHKAYTNCHKAYTCYTFCHQAYEKTAFAIRPTPLAMRPTLNSHEAYTLCRKAYTPRGTRPTPIATRPTSSSHQ